MAAEDAVTAASSGSRDEKALEASKEEQHAEVIEMESQQSVSRKESLSSIFTILCAGFALVSDGRVSCSLSRLGLALTVDDLGTKTVS